VCGADFPARRSVGGLKSLPGTGRVVVSPRLGIAGRFEEVARYAGDRVRFLGEGTQYVTTNRYVGLLAVVLLSLGGGCATLTEGKIVTREGRETPFKPMSDQYSLPKDPVTQR
jgi:hypothetical protein